MQNPRSSANYYFWDMYNREIKPGERVNGREQIETAPGTKNIGENAGATAGT
jgi:hypothetical protein